MNKFQNAFLNIFAFVIKVKFFFSFNPMFRLKEWTEQKTEPP